MIDLAKDVQPYLIESLDDMQVNLLIEPINELLPVKLIAQMSQPRSIQIQGWLKQRIAPNALVRYKSGKANAKFFVDCYVDYLAFCATPATNDIGAMVLITQDGQWRFSPFPQELARQHLSRILSYYLIGSTTPLPLFIQSGWNYIAARFDAKTLELVNDEKSIAKADKALADGINGNLRFVGEGDNPYNQRCFPEALSNEHQALIEHSIALLLPIFTHLEELDHE